MTPATAQAALSPACIMPTAEPATFQPSPTPSVGLSLQDARAAGQHGMAVSLEKAERVCPDFSERAAAAILGHLKAVGQASGEDLTDIAIAHGAIPSDARAFGGVFQAMSRRKQIQCVGFCLRRKGNATAGGRIWEIVGGR